MLVFFVFKTMVVFRYINHSTFTHYFEWLSVIFFMPPFFVVVKEFLEQKRKTLSDLSKKNIYLEHAAKIIRHDMHSGINTYLPRGIKSLNRRLTEDSIKELKIASPLKLIQDGLHHAQKVYAGVYEFTNLVKEDAQLKKSPHDIRKILEDYLKLTAYKSQVVLSDNLPEGLEVNEALFCTAVDNFIRNGLKYNDSPTKFIKIGLEANYHTGSFIVIEDNGRGITGEEFIELSKPYARKKGQKESGTGLGLNISIEILREHGFEVFAEKQDNGTKIYIKI
jgi:K+-sensing histidine kinase KdpD